MVSLGGNDLFIRRDGTPHRPDATPRLQLPLDHHKDDDDDDTDDHHFSLPFRWPCKL
jgi:hypothetical protein